MLRWVFPFKGAFFYQFHLPYGDFNNQLDNFDFMAACQLRILLIFLHATLVCSIDQSESQLRSEFIQAVSLIRSAGR